MKRIDPCWDGVIFTEAEWASIEDVCRKCKWLVVISLLREEANKPTNLALIDQKLAPLTTENTPAWLRAIPTLNQELRKAGLSFRIRKVVSSEVCGKGMVQMRRE